MFYILTTICVMFFCGCNTESSDVILDERDDDYVLYDYYVDSYGNEGIVADILKDRYIMVISADESYQSWGMMGKDIFSGDTATSFINNREFGLLMLQTMKSIGIEKFPAMEWCDRKNEGDRYANAGSWRLPSKSEFHNMAGINSGKLKYINDALSEIGAPLISEDKFYWTCVEDIEGYIKIDGMESDYDQANRAVVTSPDNFTYGVKDRWLKKNKYYVRAIKYIYYRSN